MDKLSPMRNDHTDRTLMKIDIHPRRAAALRRRLIRWFLEYARDLPWRREPEPYRVWLAEILLQQTRVEQGLPYYERFLKAFPDVGTLAAAREDEVLKLWEGLGYYARARNLLRAAKEIAAGGGVFPGTAAGWQALPGIGRYTAGAIASIAFGERAPLVDGNVARVFARLFAIGESIDDAPVIEQLWGIAARLVPAEAPGDFNQALMELGATVCVPRTPRCAECPLRPLCEAHAAGLQASLPVRRPKKPTPHHDLLVAIVEREGEVLAVQRRPEGLLGGLWEFPNCPLPEDGNPGTVLKRYLRDTLGVTAKVRAKLGVVDHAYSHFRVTLHVYGCQFRGGAPTGGGYRSHRWVWGGKLTDLAFATAYRRVAALAELDR